MNMMQTEIKEAIDKIQHFLKKADSATVKSDYNDGVFTVEFETVPSEELINRVGEIVFFTDEIELCNADELIILNGKTLEINLVSYPVFLAIYCKMKGYGFKLLCTDVAKDEIYFRYLLSSRNVLNYEELNEIQAIVNPTIEEHDSIRIVGYEGIYSLRVNLLK